MLRSSTNRHVPDRSWQNAGLGPSLLARVAPRRPPRSSRCSSKTAYPQTTSRICLSFVLLTWFDPPCRPTCLIISNVSPVTTAVTNTTLTKTATSRVLNMLASMLISGMLMPAPPMINARTAPTLIPFLVRASAMGITVSTRTYSGIPMTAAIGIASRLCRPATRTTKSPGR